MMAPRQFKDHAEDSDVLKRKLDSSSARHDADAPKCTQCLQRSLGNSYLSERGNRANKADSAELPVSGEEMPPGIDLAQEPAASALAPPESDLDVGEKKPKPCCDVDSFTASGDSYTDSATDCRKKIKFSFKVKSGGDGHKCVLVNWIQGTAKNKDGTFRRVQMFDTEMDYNFPTSRIDSLDKDPVYWSDSSARWNYKPDGTDAFFATDSPGPTTWVDGIDYDLKFKMCLYCIDDVATTSDEGGSGVKNPLKCIDWVFKAKFDAAAGTFAH